MVQNLNVTVEKINVREKITILTLRKMKEMGEKVALLSIYDYPHAILADKAGLDIIIVGDSLGMTVLGYKNTLPVTMDQMVSHAAAVRRGTDNILVVGDMPFMSYQASDELAVINAGRLIKESGCEAVKCEASRKVLGRVKAIANAEILVMGHIGLNPQKLHEMGGYRIQGKTWESTKELLELALSLQEAGVFSLLLEGVTEEVAGLIKDKLEIPVYGIGSGRLVDGQLLISHDLLNMYWGFKKVPIYIKRYLPEKDHDLDVGDMIGNIYHQYVQEVKVGKFPAEEHVHKLKPEDWKLIKAKLKRIRAK